MKPDCKPEKKQLLLSPGSRHCNEGILYKGGKVAKGATALGVVLFTLLACLDTGQSRLYAVRNEIAAKDRVAEGQGTTILSIVSICVASLSALFAGLSAHNAKKALAPAEASAKAAEESAKAAKAMSSRSLTITNNRIERIFAGGFPPNHAETVSFVNSGAVTIHLMPPTFTPDATDIITDVTVDNMEGYLGPQRIFASKKAEFPVMPGMRADVILRFAFNVFLPNPPNACNCTVSFQLLPKLDNGKESLEIEFIFCRK